MEKEQSTYTYRVRCLLRFIILFLCVSPSALLPGQISISGVTHKSIYSNKVTFSINTEAGYNYTARLNGAPVATGTPVLVDIPEYYELSVARTAQSSGTEESVVVQFIVRASERFDTEVGLPVWTPYPMIDSSSAEFSGGTLTIVTPSVYPQGLEIPVIARVNNSAGKRMGVNGSVSAAGFEEYPLSLYRGVGSMFLPAATEDETISYTASIHSLQTPKQIAIETATTWQTVSGTVTGTVTWGEHARIRISDTLTIASDAALTIGAGSIIVVAADAEIAVAGRIVVNGTNVNPVVFTAQDRAAPWGGFLFESSTSLGEFTGTIFTASGADSNWVSNNPGHGSFHKPQQCLFYLSNAARVTLTDCYVVENKGQLGHGENGYLTLQRCLVQKLITGGQYNGGSVTVNDSAVIEVPYAGAPFADADNDAFYLSGGAHYLTDSLIGWTLDDGIDAGQGAAGSLTVSGCWFESCIHEAMAISSGPRYATVTDTVVINCGQAMESGYDGAFIDADHCLCTGNVIGARFGDNYARSYTGFLDVKNSLLLFNHRDVWGLAWDTWQWHLSQMDIQDNYLSVPTAYHPGNTVWDPQNAPEQLTQLDPFLTTASAVVGIGIAMPGKDRDIAELQPVTKIPVRLSTFSTVLISVDYTIDTNEGFLAGGTLHFIPGQTVQVIEFARPSLDNLRQLRIVLSNPINAEPAGCSSVLYRKPYVLNKTLIGEGDQWQYFKGTSEPDIDWNQTEFTPGDAWLTGPSGFGYETGTGYGPCIATNLTDMKGRYYSVYARKLFRIDNPQRVVNLRLGMRWDDGFIAYINGRPVENQYGPLNPAYNQPASTSDHEACCSCSPDQFDLSDFAGILVPGDNVLALQVHNTSLNSSDFLFIPELFCTESPIPGDIEPDGDVDLKDFAIFSEAWLAEEGQNRYVPACDIDSLSDGIINMEDVAVFVQHWMVSD